MQSFAQNEETKTKFFKKYPFVNQSEFGLLLGKVKNTNYFFPFYRMDILTSYIPQDNYTLSNVVDFNVKTFNGVYIKPKKALGITAGMDWYNSTLLMPISLGVRQTIAQKSEHGSKFYSSLDLGYANTWAHVDNSNEKTKGGISINPSVGLKFPMKSGSYWLLNLGYRYQQYSVSRSIDTDPIYSDVENRNLNRIDFKLGFEF